MATAHLNYALIKIGDDENIKENLKENIYIFMFVLVAGVSFAAM